MTSTAKYQLSLPFVLLAASPSLAALHATRARTLHPTESASLDSTHCIKCGSYLFNGDGAICIVRPSKRRKSSEREGCRKVMRRTCGICGFSHNIPIDSSSDCLFPRTRKAMSSGTTISAPAEQSQPSEEAPHERAANRSMSLPRSSPFGSYGTITQPGIAPIAPSSGPAAQRRSKSRQKKSGLQDMLSRNRDNEEKRKKEKNEGHGGLAALLSGL